MAAQAAKMGKKCNGCGVWNRPHPVGNSFDPGQKCFVPACKCILYQGMPKDKYPGKHHRPGEPKGGRASGTSSVGGADAILRNTRQPVAPAVGARHVPSPNSPWGKDKQLNKVLKDLEAAKKEVEQLRTKGQESEPETAEVGNDYSKAVKECRANLHKCKTKLAEAEKEGDEEILAVLRPRKDKAEAVLQAALDQQQAAKPVDQRQKELEREVKRLEGSCKQQDTTNTDLTKAKEEALAAERAGLERATSLKEQLAQAKKKLEAAKLEQAPAGELATSSTSLQRQFRLPREGEGQEGYVQRRMEMAQTSLPPSLQPTLQQKTLLQEAFIEEFKAAKADSNAVLPWPAQEPDDDAEMGEVDIDSIEDSLLDDLHMLNGGADGDGDANPTPEQHAERRTKQKEQLKVQKQKGSANRVLQNLIKPKRGGAGASAKTSDLR